MFGKKTVDSIASAFHSMVSDLEGVIEHAEAEAARHAKAAEDAIRARAEHMEESAKASRLAANIRGLLK